tara:strand:+ start:11573 stop:11998 length:426 start_codon:yes stop_codon:yes gene_type:complete
MVMEHTDYLELSGNGVKLLLEFAYQYRGNNNGDLTAAWTVLKKRGWRSQHTVSKALRELQEANLVICSRESVFHKTGGRCALFALTWLPINECPGKGLDILPTKTPARRFNSASIIKLSSAESAQGPVQKLHTMAVENGRN